MCPCPWRSPTVCRSRQQIWYNLYSGGQSAALPLFHPIPTAMAIPSDSDVICHNSAISELRSTFGTRSRPTNRPTSENVLLSNSIGNIGESGRGRGRLKNVRSMGGGGGSRWRRLSRSSSSPRPRVMALLERQVITALSLARHSQPMMAMPCPPAPAATLIGFRRLWHGQWHFTMIDEALYCGEFRFSRCANLPLRIPIGSYIQTVQTQRCKTSF